MMSGPPGRTVVLGPRYDWLHFIPLQIAFTAIHASGRARTASSIGCDAHSDARRPENPHSSAYISRMRTPNTARLIGYSRFRASKPWNLVRVYSGATKAKSWRYAGRNRLATQAGSRLAVAGDTTAHAFTRNKSAAEKTIFSAAP